MAETSQERFIVVSGLPGSGKSTLARQLAPLLNLPVIDKDSLLEALFASKGVGDAAWRRALSRESDTLLRCQAMASNGAILVSFWHQAGMAADSGTPTAWLSDLSAQIVNVHCVCSPETAAERFLRRERHPGHLDVERSTEETVKGLRAIANLQPLPIRRRIEVDTNQEVNPAVVVRDLKSAFFAMGVT